MDKKLRDAVRSLLADIDAMRCEAPYDIRQDGDTEDRKHWFGGFGNCTIEDDGKGIVQWPNLSILSEQIYAMLPPDRVVTGRPLDQ